VSECVLDEVNQCELEKLRRRLDDDVGRHVAFASRVLVFGRDGCECPVDERRQANCPVRRPGAVHDLLHVPGGFRELCELLAGANDGRGALGEPGVVDPVPELPRVAEDDCHVVSEVVPEHAVEHFEPLPATDPVRHVSEHDRVAQQVVVLVGQLRDSRLEHCAAGPGA